MTGNGERDGTKVERSIRMMICCNKSDGVCYRAKSSDKRRFGYEVRHIGGQRLSTGGWRPRRAVSLMTVRKMLGGIACIYG